MFSVHKGHSVPLGIFMLYRASAGAQTKAAAAAINCSSGQKRKVNQCCFFFFFSPAHCLLSLDGSAKPRPRPSGSEAVCLTSHRSCLRSGFLRGCGAARLASALRSSSTQSLSQEPLFVFCLLIGSCFVLPLAAPHLA